VVDSSPFASPRANQRGRLRQPFGVEAGVVDVAHCAVLRQGRVEGSRSFAREKNVSAASMSSSLNA
jgi:hypothetical protein